MRAHAERFIRGHESVLCSAIELFHIKWVALPSTAAARQEWPMREAVL